MNISLTKTLDNFVQEQVNSWLYTSASEVIRTGLRVLAEREKERQEELELNRKIKIWIAQADAGLWKEFNDEFVENLFLSVKKRLSANKIKSWTIC